MGPGGVVALVFVVGFLAAATAVVWYFFTRRRGRYVKVSHSLDSEEIAFKTALDQLGADIDEFPQFDDPHDAHDLDDIHLEQLKMLEEEITQNMVSSSTQDPDDIRDESYFDDVKAYEGKQMLVSSHGRRRARSEDEDDSTESSHLTMKRD